MQDLHVDHCESSTLAFPDPIPTQTVNSVTYDFVRTGLKESKGLYKTADGLDRLSFENTATKRLRSVVRLDRTALIADPTETGKSYDASMSTYLVVDRPRYGFNAAACDWHWKLLKSIMDEGTPDYSLRFLRDEV